MPSDDIPSERKGLFFSYGEQLQEANFIELPSAICKEILDHCPNVRCHWNSLLADSEPTPLDKFRLLAPRLDSLRFDESKSEWLNSSTTRKKFEAALSTLTDLTSCAITFSWEYEDDVPNSVLITNCIFAEPRYSLDFLKLVLPKVDRDMMLKLLPSLYEVRTLIVDEEEVKGDGLVRLFEACPLRSMAMLKWKKRWIGPPRLSMSRGRRSI